MKKNRQTYDEVTEFDRRTGAFYCRDCGSAMKYDQGLFASPNSWKHNLITAMTCPRCGHALDARLPQYALVNTPESDPIYTVRIAAAWAIYEAVDRIVNFAAIRAAWQTALDAEAIDELRAALPERVETPKRRGLLALLFAR